MCQAPLRGPRLPAILELGVLSTRAMVAERTGDQDRAAMLGYLGMAHGIGGTVSAQVQDLDLPVCAADAAA